MDGRLSRTGPFGVFLKRRRQSVRLICFEIYGPARRIGADFLFNMIAYLVFPCVSFKRADTPDTSIVFIPPSRPARRFMVLRPAFWGIAFLLYLAERSGNRRF